jgi:anti-sigma B factor antagonist
MPGAGYELGWAGGIPVIATPGEIDVSNAAEFRQSLLSCANGHPTLVVDMSGTVFCDSTGVHQLVLARARAIAAGGEVRLVIRTAPVQRLFAIMGIDHLFPVFASPEQAVACAPSPAPVSQPLVPHPPVPQPVAAQSLVPQPAAAQQSEARAAPG